ncbi:MAG: CRISPR-associated endonuclease Cas1 [Thermoproteales archaeon]|nr:CRISPR-associated endonuclease Cas1 [Thermoproteales archaeon]
MKKILVLSGYGVSLRARKGMFEISEKGRKPVQVAPVEIEAILIDTKAASITSSAIMLAAKLGIDLIFMDKWRPLARLLPATYGSTLNLWIKQLVAVKKRRLEYAKTFAYAKAYNQRMILYDLLKRFPGTKFETRRIRARLNDSIKTITEMLKMIDEANDVTRVRSYEAQAAKSYWKAVSIVLPSELNFSQRIKRYSGIDPDPFNIALNIGYSALLREVWRAVFVAGLNPYYGFLHVRRPGRMSLVLDLMEEFRAPAVDRPLIRLGRKNPKIFLKLKNNNKESVSLIWQTIIENINKQPHSIKSKILTQARKLATSISEKKAYTAYKSKW